MSLAAIRPVGPWGDRTYLLPKEMVYVLSLYVKAQVDGRFLTVTPDEAVLSHVFGDTVVTMPEGLRCDLPVGDLAGGTGEIGVADDPSSMALQLRLQLVLNGTDNLLMDCSGVVNFHGGMAAFRMLPTEDLSGSAFMSSRHETDSPTFRWFNRRQLFGVGRVCGGVPSESRELELSFDLYACA